MSALRGIVRLSLSAQVIIGLVVGIASGIFFGPVQLLRRGRDRAALPAGPHEHPGRYVQAVRDR